MKKMKRREKKKDFWFVSLAFLDEVEVTSRWISISVCWEAEKPPNEQRRP